MGKSDEDEMTHEALVTLLVMSTIVPGRLEEVHPEGFCSTCTSRNHPKYIIHEEQTPIPVTPKQLLDDYSEQFPLIKQEYNSDILPRIKSHKLWVRGKEGQKVYYTEKKN